MEPSAEFSSSYAAFFAPRTHKFETVSFRLPTTREFLHSYFPHSSRDVVRRARLAGLLGVLVGLVTAVVGFAVDQLTRGLTHGLYIAVEALFDEQRFWPGTLVYAVIALVYTAVAACLVVYIAPLGAGSGVPELKSYLNGVKIPGFLRIDSLFVKTVGIAFSLSSGLIVGKQGPMIHAGAIIGAGMSQFASSKFKWRWNNRHVNFLRTEAWKRDFCAVGAAVGIAVAFGSPMGAWMWVYEEACTHWTWDLGIITLSGCLTGAVAARILNYLATGLPRGFDLFTITQFGKLVTPFDGASFLIKDVPAFFALAVLGGVLGVIMPIVNKQITLFRYKHIKKPVPRIAEALGITFLTLVMRLIIPYLVDDCRPVSEDLTAALRVAPLGNYARFNCDESEFSPWAAVMYNPTDSVVRGLLFSKGPNLFPAAAVGVSFAYYFFFIVWTYGVAVPAGVFFPALLLGTVYGRLFGIAVQAMFPGRTDVSLTAYAFLGSISALAGFTRTISVALIVLEATAGNDATFATVFVALVAKLVGDVLYKNGIYDLHIELKGIPFLSSKVPKLELYRKLHVSDVMQSSVIGVRRLARVSGLVHMLGTNDHHAFPVFLKVSGSGVDEASLYTADSKTTDSSGGAGNELKHAGTSFLERTLDEAGDSDDSEDQGTNGTQQSRIITPSQDGMQATIFEDGVTHVVHLTEGGEVRKIADVSTDAGGVRRRHGSRRAGGKDSNEDGVGAAEEVSTDDGKDGEDGVPRYELIGTVDRGTLLTLLEHECKRAEAEVGAQAEAEAEAEADGKAAGVSLERLDAAWPNAGRLKGDAEKQLMRRVEAGGIGIGRRVIDLRRYVDTDPVLMSARALSSSAYLRLRSTGARHILVTDTRRGRVCGIMTRKDILLESVKEVLERKEKLEAVKVE